MIYWVSLLPPEVDYSKLGSEVKLLLEIISFIVFRKPQLKIEIAYSSLAPVKGFNDIFRAMKQVKGQPSSARKEDNLDEELEL